MIFFMHRRIGCRRDSIAVRILAMVFIALAIIGVLVVLLPREAAAQRTPPRATRAEPRSTVRDVAILILRGPDTLVVERIRRAGDSVTARILAPGQPTVTLGYSLAPDHRVASLDFRLVAANAASDATPLQTGRVTFVGDSAILTIAGGGQSRDLRREAGAQAWPIVNNDFVLAEQAVRVARARGVRSMPMNLFALSNAMRLQGTLELVGDDSARFSVMGNVTTVAVDAEGNVTGGVVAAQGLEIKVLGGPQAVRVSFGRPDYSAPAGAPYTAEEVTVRTPQGHALSGTLTVPAARGGRVPAVVTITGSGQQDRDEFLPFAGGVRIFRQVADTLSRRGVAVLRLDDRGIGGSGGDANGTSEDFADDIRAAVAYLRTRSEVDPDRIALVGHSEGGMIAPMVAATDPRIAAIVLMAGTAYTGQRIIDYQYANVVRGDPAIPAAAKDSVLRAMKRSFDAGDAKRPWMRFFLTYDPLPTAARVKQPVLIMQGATDQQVRPIEARMLDSTMRAAGNTRVTLRSFPARNHLFLRDSVGHPSGYAELPNGRVDAEVLGTLAEWLVATLKP